MAAPKTNIPGEVRDLIARAVAEPDAAISEDLLRQADELRQSDTSMSGRPGQADVVVPVYERAPGQNWWRRVIRVWTRPRSTTFH